MVLSLFFSLNEEKTRLKWSAETRTYPVTGTCFSKAVFTEERTVPALRYHHWPFLPSPAFFFAPLGLYTNSNSEFWNLSFAALCSQLVKWWCPIILLTASEPLSRAILVTTESHCPHQASVLSVWSCIDFKYKIRLYIIVINMSYHYLTPGCYWITVALILGRNVHAGW